MAKTAAQRQRDYRARRDQGGEDRRLNLWVRTGAHEALERLATRHGLTKRAMLEQLIQDADESGEQR